MGDMVNDLDIKDAVLTRQFDLRKGGHVHTYIWKPETGRPYEYRCIYRIVGLSSGDRTRSCGGADSLQAFWHALLSVGLELYASSDYKAGSLTYLGSRDLSLPMHEGLRGDGQTFASAELLSIISEVSVVRLPDQVFGAAAVSGRLFKDFADDCGEAVRCLTSDGTPIPEALSRLSRRLKDYLEYYEEVCKHEGVELPYVNDA